MRFVVAGAPRDSLYVLDALDVLYDRDGGRASSPVAMPLGYPSECPLRVPTASSPFVILYSPGSSVTPVVRG